MPDEHRPWSTFADAELIAPFNPLRRVPVLVLDDGEALVDSSAILDHLDETAQRDRRALIATDGPERRRALKVCALAAGLAEKAVSLVYERVLHEQESAQWVERCEAQIASVLDMLEADRTSRDSHFWFGPEIEHADIAVACALRFTREAHPAFFSGRRLNALSAHAGRCEGLPEFRAVVQPFIPPV
jgi:glutathione S-transferase